MHTFFIPGDDYRKPVGCYWFQFSSELSQAKTKSEEKRFNITCLKVTNNWSAKPIKGILMQIWKSPICLCSYKNNTLKMPHSQS